MPWSQYIKECSIPLKDTYALLSLYQILQIFQDAFDIEFSASRVYIIKFREYFDCWFLLHNCNLHATIFASCTVMAKGYCTYHVIDSYVCPWQGTTKGLDTQRQPNIYYIFYTDDILCNLYNVQ
jgi:hypothetical protein